VSIHATASKSSGAFSGQQYTLELEIPDELALTLMFAAGDSKKKCSERLYSALYWETSESWCAGDSKVEVSVTYNDAGWKSWVLKIIDDARVEDDHRKSQLEKLRTVIDNA